MQKIELLAKKYFIILKHLNIPFKLNRSNITLNHKKLYYHSPIYGLASIQSMYIYEQAHFTLCNLTGIKTIIDIGASVGNFTILSNELYPKAKIYSIEPISESFNCLSLNTKSNQNNMQFNTAISDKTGYSYMSENSEKSIIAPSGIQVDAITLDQFIINQSITQIDLLKIDAEKHEANILLGAAKALEITRYLYIEVTIFDNPNYTFTSLLKLLSTEEYNFQLLIHSDHYYKNKPEKITMMNILLKNIKYNETVYK
ncbi:MAG: FkbM family methyltransferase [bacterium]|nr:FkbM family methyltransferase [bacterium]